MWLLWFFVIIVILCIVLGVCYRRTKKKDKQAIKDLFRKESIVTESDYSRKSTLIMDHDDGIEDVLGN